MQVEKSGFVVDYKNFVLDGKVIDLHENPVCGIVEIKCPKEYKDLRPRYICYISKNPCCDFVLYTNKDLVVDRIRYNEDHSSKNYWHFILSINYHASLKGVQHKNLVHHDDSSLFKRLFLKSQIPWNIFRGIGVALLTDGANRGGWVWPTGNLVDQEIHYTFIVFLQVSKTGIWNTQKVLSFIWN